MTNKTILSFAVIMAFVAGTITTGTFAYAQQSGGIPQALEELESQFTGIQNFLLGIDDRVTQNEIKVNTLQSDVDQIKNPQRYEVFSTDVVQFEFGNQHMKRAECNPGDHLVTGGVNLDDVTASAQPAKIIDSLPRVIDGIELWQVRAEVSDLDNVEKFVVVALCETAVP